MNGRSPTTVLVEGLVDPVGVDEAQPRLSWARRHAEPIEVVVHEAAKEVWRHKVPAGTGWVDLPADVLDPLAEYECRVGDASGRFVTGLRSRGEWTAPWIAADPDTASGAVAVTGAVAWAAEPGRVWLASTALGVYRVHVNGDRVGDEELAPGWTDYARRVRYRLHELTDLLRDGDNTVEVWLAPGWYAGHVGAFGTQRYGARPAVSAQLLHRNESGVVSTLLTTGPSWQCSDLGRPRADLMMGETVTSPPPPASTRPISVVPVSTPSVEADPLPPVLVTDTIAAALVTEPEPGVHVVDFGRILTGRVTLAVTGPARLIVTHGEELTAAGRVYTANLRSAEQRDEFVVGPGSHVVEPAFTVHGFRYAEVRGWPGPLEIADVSASALRTALRTTGSLTASDPVVRQLIANIQASAEGNMISVPVDCPQRDERLGWTADISVFASTLSFLFDTRAFLASWLTALIDGQRADGAVPHVAPVVPEYGYDAPVWGDAIVEVPWLLWRRYGDDRTLRRAYEPMRRWVDYCIAQCDDGVRPGRAFGDWLAPGVVETPASLIATAALARSLRIVSKIGTVLGEPSAADYGASSDMVAEAFRREFVAGNRLRTPTQTGYSAMLAWDLVPEHDRQPTLDALVALVEADGFRLTTGFVGTPLLLPVLSGGGRHDVAARIFNQEGYPSWRYQARAGATTMWERWDSWHHRRGLQTPTMNSFNHYAYGCVGDWLFRHVAGIGDDPRGIGGGFTDLLLRPGPLPLLRQVHARYDSVAGPVESGWRAEHDVLQFFVAIPAGTKARVQLPVSGGWDTMTMNGDFMMGLSETVQIERLADGSAEFDIPAGRWFFTAATPPALLEPWDTL